MIAYSGVGGGAENITFAPQINAAPKPSAAAPSTGKKLNFLGWAVLLLGLYAINGNRTGHEIIFYSMVLIVLFLFVYNYQRILPVLTKNA